MRLLSFLPGGGIGKIHASSIDNASQPHLLNAASFFARLPRKKCPPIQDDVAPQDEALAFTMTLIALAARLSLTLRRSPEQCYHDFLRIFPIPKGEHAKSKKLFDEALNDYANTSFYIRQIATLYENHPAIHQQLVQRLMQLATWNERLSSTSYHFIMDIADACRINDTTMQHIFTVALVPANESEAMRWLRVGSADSVHAFKSHYRHEMQAYHPDHMAKFARNHRQDSLLTPVLARRAAMLSTAYRNLLPQAA